LKVRRKGLSAVIDGYTLIPVFNFVRPNVYDDIAWQGCNYAATNRHYRYPREDTYSAFSPYVLEKMRHSTALAFNLTAEQEQNLTYV
jgi:hypothetical protein